MGTAWNEDRVSALRRLWAEGHATAEIGHRLRVKPYGLSRLFPPIHGQGRSGKGVILYRGIEKIAHGETAK